MGKVKEDGKEKYRKPKYTPKVKRDFDGELNDFIKASKKLPKNSTLKTF